MLILNGMFSSWIDEFVDSENDRILWDVWVHKVHDISYAEFKERSLKPKEEISEKQAADVVTDSFNILNEFIPPKGE